MLDADCIHEIGSGVHPYGLSLGRYNSELSGNAAAFGGAAAGLNGTIVLGFHKGLFSLELQC